MRQRVFTGIPKCFKIKLIFRNVRILFVFEVLQYTCNYAVKAADASLNLFFNMFSFLIKTVLEINNTSGKNEGSSDIRRQKIMGYFIQVQDARVFS